ncbi:MAG: Gfo/Idh/MocA family oxidoreductase [Planctomycetota bacterium]|nr:Gfo/Idh/MocA family oxidoreductase [Planctomycetota bacterium]
MSRHVNRRDFIRKALAAGTAIPAASMLSSRILLADDTTSANEKLRLGVIGVDGRGGSNLSGVSSENIVALCDIDDMRLDKAAASYPDAKKFNNCLDLLEMNDLDGVVVSTPDHMHAIPVATALRKKLPTYCEKPLTHSIYEARVLRDLAIQAGVPTQMGNQIHSESNYRRVVEAIQGGVIGPIRRVHVWHGGTVAPGKRSKESTPPKHVHYDLWLGPAPYRPYDESSFHFNWRWWWDFGGGTLADFVCHYVDLPVWALNLTLPEVITAEGSKNYEGDNDTPSKLKVEYEFPARGLLPAVHMTWHHGGGMPDGAEEYGKGSAVLFEGEDGRLLADYGTRKVFMNTGKEEKAIAQTIPDSIGHHKEWIESIKTGSRTMSPFTYGVILTEIGHLGNVSYRAGQKRLEWDADAMQAPNCPEADQFIKREYREGWTL